MNWNLREGQEGKETRKWQTRSRRALLSLGWRRIKMLHPEKNDGYAVALCHW